MHVPHCHCGRGYAHVHMHAYAHVHTTLNTTERGFQRGLCMHACTTLHTAETAHGERRAPNRMPAVWLTPRGVCARRDQGVYGAHGAATALQPWASPRAVGEVVTRAADRVRRVEANGPDTTPAAMMLTDCMMEAIKHGLCGASAPGTSAPVTIVRADGEADHTMAGMLAGECDFVMWNSKDQDMIAMLCLHNLCPVETHTACCSRGVDLSALYSK